jgi:hypothetical protein
LFQVRRRRREQLANILKQLERLWNRNKWILPELARPSYVTSILERWGESAAKLQRSLVDEEKAELAFEVIKGKLVG